MNLLIIFAKNPVTEDVKTRLAKEVGKKKASEIYEDILLNLIEEHSGKEYDLKLYIQGNLDYFHDLAIHRIPQKGNNLGEKLENAFDELKNYEKVIVIGSDCPDISSDFIIEAFNELKESIIGPATDGGYYLIGLTKKLNIFKGISWGTNKVFKETVNKLGNVKILKEKRDVDTKDDATYYKLI